MVIETGPSFSTRRVEAAQAAQAEAQAMARERALLELREQAAKTALAEARAGAAMEGRDFALFERRDDLAKLGVDPAQIDGFDATDDAALDKHIADCTDCLRALGHAEDEVSVTAQVGEPSPFGEGYTTLYPGNYDPARSNGISAIVTQPMIDAALTNQRLMAPNGSGRERVILGVPDGAGGYRIIQPDVRAGSSATANTATYTPPADTAWGGHGHLEDADGFLDVPERATPFGDASTLHRGNPYPNFTLFNGKLGWHDMENGRLRFTYPNGSMTLRQLDQMQRNLEIEQRRFQDGK